VLAESDVAGAEDNLEVARANTRATVRALQVLLGRYPTGTFDIPATFPHLSDVIAAGQPAQILRRRPDVLSAEYNVRAAFAGKYATRAGTWPALNLSADISSAVANLGDLFDPADMALSLGGRLADTWFDGGLSRARIDAAGFSAEQALRSYGQTVLDAFADVEGRLDDLSVIDRRRVLVGQETAAARETLRLAEIQYKEGAVDLIDVLNFRQRSFQSARTLLAVERQQLNARIALYLALGGASKPVSDSQ